MATEGRPPEDLQEAVAATLRRLRGEVGATAPRPAQRIEPQLSMPAAAPEAAPEPTDEPPSPADEAPFAAEPPVQMPAPARRLEPDLLSAVSQTDIPPIPSSHGQGPSAYEPVEEATAEEYVAPRRPWLRYVAALVVLIAFAVVGWWGYRHFAGRAGSGQVPVVAADQTPEKVPPADQPATQTQSQQETVYNQISPGSTAQQPEVLLPQPETPSTPPAPAASTTAPSTTTQSGAASVTAAPSVPAVPAPPPAAGSTTTGSTTTGNSTGTLTETSCRQNPRPRPPRRLRRGRRPRAKRRAPRPRRRRPAPRPRLIRRARQPPTRRRREQLPPRLHRPMTRRRRRAITAFSSRLSRPRRMQRIPGNGWRPNTRISSVPSRCISRRSISAPRASITASRPAPSRIRMRRGMSAPSLRPRGSPVW